MKNEHCIDVCNRLLRGEQSAVATYAKVIANHPDKVGTSALDAILDDHRKAVLTLTDNILSMGGEPSHDSGVWGDFANTVQSVADAMGDDAALRSLQTGEKAGQRDYEIALQDDDVMPECKEMMRSQLLPPTLAHIRTLEGLLKAA